MKILLLIFTLVYWNTNLLPPTSSPGPSPLCSIQNGGSGGECLNTPKSPGVFCRVNDNEISSFYLNNGFRLPENKHGYQSLEITCENISSEKTLDKPKYSKNRGVFCHVTRNEMYSEVISVTSRHIKTEMKYNTTAFFLSIVTSMF